MPTKRFGGLETSECSGMGIGHLGASGTTALAIDRNAGVQGQA